MKTKTNKMNGTKKLTIKNELSPILNEFLNDESLFSEFKKMSKAVGYNGDDPELIKASLFCVNNKGEIGFVIAELNGIFNNWNVEKVLKNHPIFGPVWEKLPDERSCLLDISKKILNGDELSDESEECLLKLIERAK